MFNSVTISKDKVAWASADLHPLQAVIFDHLALPVNPSRSGGKAKIRG